MTAKTILEKARELVKRGWCKGAAARTGKGRSTYPGDPYATKFCSVGACERALHNKHPSPTEIYLASGVYNSVIEVLCEAMQTVNILSWNDDPLRLKTDVLDAYDKAIASLSEVPDTVPDGVPQEAPVA